MVIAYHKYHGTGNDFIIMDDRQRTFPRSDQSFIAGLCQRRFGIGADGLLLIDTLDGYDFHMIYYNSDGSPSSFCGNGSRCITHLAHRLGIVGETCSFLASDGPHSGRIDGDMVTVKMRDVREIRRTSSGDCLIDTGSPHIIRSVDDLEQDGLMEQARKLRYSNLYRAEGVNVNFVKHMEDSISMRTYERGVEAETFSCGTGVTAAALDWADKRPDAQSVDIYTRGGELSVQWKRTEHGYEDIWLSGPATHVSYGHVHYRGSVS